MLSHYRNHCLTPVVRAILALFSAFLLLSCSLFSAAENANPVAVQPTATNPVLPSEQPRKTSTPVPTEAPTSTSTPSPTETEVPPTPTKIPPTEDPNRSVSPVDGMVLLFVPEGEFLMGTEEDLPEHPTRKYWLDAFWIDQTEVTIGMYGKCITAGGCTKLNHLPDLFFEERSFQAKPITMIDFQQAENYCAWAGRRLPTSAEWEKAARGTDERPYPWGTEPFDTALCNGGRDPSGEADYKKVGSYPEGASPYGALDMCGNVSELVSDYYGYYGEMNEPYKNPTGPASGTMKVIRGGSYEFIQTYDYFTWGRNWLAEDSWASDVGIRCAISDKDFKK